MVTFTTWNIFFMHSQIPHSSLVAIYLARFRWFSDIRILAKRSAKYSNDNISDSRWLDFQCFIRKLADGMPRLHSVVAVIRPSTNASNCGTWLLTRNVVLPRGHYVFFAPFRVRKPSKGRRSAVWVRIKDTRLSSLISGIDIIFNEALVAREADSRSAFRQRHWRSSITNSCAAPATSLSASSMTGTAVVPRENYPSDAVWHTRRIRRKWRRTRRIAQIRPRDSLWRRFEI